MYVAGWLKNGPSGVIVSTMSDAYETAATIVNDLQNMAPSNKKGANGIFDLLHSRGVRPVSYTDWKKIEAAEFAAGEKLGKPREKYTKIEDMLAVLNS